MHKFMADYGINTQRSVFECDIDENDLKKIRAFACENLDLKKDSLRIYRICSSCVDKELVLGKGIKVVNAKYCVY